MALSVKIQTAMLDWVPFDSHLSVMRPGDLPILPVFLGVIVTSCLMFLLLILLRLFTHPYVLQFSKHGKSYDVILKNAACR